MNKGISASQKGFTLIELLVVISIIALLAGVALVSMSRARIKGRDAKRISDINAIIKAAEIFNDSYGFYPVAPGMASWDDMYDTFATCLTTGTSCYKIDNGGNVVAATVNNFRPVISKVPQDPQYVRGRTGPADGGTIKFYWPPYPTSPYDGSKFIIRTQLEDTSDLVLNNASGGNYYTYANGCALPYYCIKLK